MTVRIFACLSFLVILLKETASILAAWARTSFANEIVWTFDLSRYLRRHLSKVLSSIVFFNRHIVQIGELNFGVIVHATQSNVSIPHDMEPFIKTAAMERRTWANVANLSKVILASTPLLSVDCSSPVVISEIVQINPREIKPMLF
jgi:hypothetical protein